MSEHTRAEEAMITAYAQKVHASTKASEDEKAGRVFGYGRGLIDGRDLTDDERFCHLCAAGLDSSQHNTECVGSENGLAADRKAQRAEALREAANDWSDWDGMSAPETWLRKRSDWIEAGDQS